MMTSASTTSAPSANVLAFPKTGKPAAMPTEKPETVVVLDDAVQAKPKATKKPAVAKAAAPKTVKAAKPAKAPPAVAPKSNDKALTLEVSDKPLHLLRARDGAYWLPEVARACGPIGVFLVNTATKGGAAADGEWDGNQARPVSTWQGECIDVLHFEADERFAKLIESALKAAYPKATATLMAVEKQTDAESKFSPAERTGVAMMAEREAAKGPAKKPAAPKGDAAKKPPVAKTPAKKRPEGISLDEWNKADDKQKDEWLKNDMKKTPPVELPKLDKPATPPAIVAPLAAKPEESPAMPPAPPAPPAAAKLTDSELKQELEARGVRRLADFRDLGVKLGFSFSAPKAASGTPRAPGQIGVWALVLGLMRKDQGATDAEIALRCSDMFGDDKRSTTGTNIGALRMLCGGRGAKEAAFTIAVAAEEGRGKVYRLVGARLNDKPGILNEAAKCLMQDKGATEAEILAHLVATFKDRHTESSLKSTVATQLSMWRSVISPGAAEATFSINLGADAKPVYRLR